MSATVKGAVAPLLEALDAELLGGEQVLRIGAPQAGVLFEDLRAGHATSEPEDDGQIVVLSPTITRFVRSNVDVAMLYGARGEGKSCGGISRVLRLSAESPQAWPVRWMVVRDTWVNISRTLLPTLKHGHKMGWWTCEFRDAETECILNDGLAHLFFWGMDNDRDANKFQGFEAGGLWLEEPAPAADINSGIPASVLALGASSLRQPGVKYPSVQITMNPPDDDHWTLELAEQLEELAIGHLKHEVFRIPTGENPHLPPGYRERMRALLEGAGRQDLVRRLVEGNIGTVKLGEPVTPEFSDAHIAKGPIPIRLNWPTYRAYDFGLNPTCIWAQTSPLGHLNVLGCIVGMNMGIEELIEQHVLPWQAKYGLNRVITREERGDYHFVQGKTTAMRRRPRIRDIGDSAGNTREQSSSERSARRSLEALLNTTFEPAPVEWAARRDSIKAVLTRMVGGRPMVQIDPEAAPLIQALRGRWRYHRSPSGRVSEQPIKDMCVDDETEMLTASGWKNYRQLVVGETVYGYDLRRRRLKPGPLRAIHVHETGPYDVIRFAHARLDMVVTPQHRCLVEHRWTKGPRLVIAADLIASDIVLRAAPAEDQRKPWYTDDFVRICAWTMAEGTYRRPSGAIHIVQSFEANPDYCAELDALISRLGGWHVHDVARGRDPRGMRNGGYRVWRLAGEMADAIRAVMPAKYPTGAFICRLTNHQRRLFLYEMIRGDGTWHRVDGPLPPPVKFPRTRAFFVRSTSPVIFQVLCASIDALQMIATLAGIGTTIRRQRGYGPLRSDGGPPGSDGWAISFSRRLTATSVDKFDRIPETRDLVWCPETTTGTWVARRHGRVFLTGNSSHPGDAFGYLCATLWPVHELIEAAMRPAPRRPQGPGPGSFMGR